MQNSPLLPPPAAAAADVAASLSADSPLAAGEGEDSFESVLETQLKGLSDGEPAQTSDASVAPDAAPAQQGAALATFLANLPAAAMATGDTGRPAVSADAASNSGAQPTVMTMGVPDRRPAEQPLAGGNRAAGEGLALSVAQELRGREAAEPSGGFHGLLEAGARNELLHPSHGMSASKAPVVEAAAEPRLPLSASVGSREWSGQFTERVTWVAQTRQSSAELILNPPQLGPVEVHVSVSVEQVATLSFHAAHPAVREAIQGSLSRLQEAFASSGLQLAEVFVGSGAPGSGGDQRSAGEFGRGAPAQRGSAHVAVGVVASGVAAAQRWNVPGRVDLFA